LSYPTLLKKKKSSESELHRDGGSERRRGSFAWAKKVDLVVLHDRARREVFGRSPQKKRIKGKKMLSGELSIRGRVPEACRTQANERSVPLSVRPAITGRNQVPRKVSKEGKSHPQPAISDLLQLNGGGSRPSPRLRGSRGDTNSFRQAEAEKASCAISAGAWGGG